MKIRLIQILILATIGFLSAGIPASGQDGSPTDYENSDAERDRYERERIINSPGEGEIRYIPRNPNPQSPAVVAKTTSDTAVSRPMPIAPPAVKPEQPAKPPEKPVAQREDDSILSFNFLYYIIQKYKLQDIVD